MVKAEIYGKFIDGSNLIRSYSDSGYYIERDGVRYEEAIDPENMHRTYTETDELIPMTEEEEEMNAAEMLNILLGGES